MVNKTYKKLMKKLTILAALLASALCPVAAQPKDRIRISNEKMKFETMEFDVPLHTYQFDFDANGNYYTTTGNQVKSNGKNTGKIAFSVFRVSDRQKMWGDVFKPGKKTYELTKFGVLKNTPMKMSMLNLDKGSSLWSKMAVAIAGVANDKMVGISKSSIMKMTTYDFATAKKRWSKFINTIPGLTYSQPIDSVSDYIVMDALYRVNWETGEMKSVPAKASIFSREILPGHYLTPIIIEAGSGMTDSRYTQQIYTPASLPEHIKKIRRHFIMLPDEGKIGATVSGIMPYNGKNYFADRNSLRCFDDDMNVIWTTELPTKATRSDVIVKDGVVYVVNLGMGLFANYGTMNAMGKPYIAAFSAADGKQLAIERMTPNESPVYSTAITEDKVYALFMNHIVSMSRENYKMETVLHPTDSNGRMYSFVSSNSIYRKTTDGHFSAIPTTKFSVPVLTEKGYVIDVKSNPAKVISSPETTYLCLGSYRDKYVITNMDEIWCLEGDKATLICDNVKNGGVVDNRIEILTNNDKAIVVFLDQKK